MHVFTISISLLITATTTKMSSEDERPHERNADVSTYSPEAAALYQRLREDPAAALREVTAMGNKDTLNWLLNNAPEFAPQGEVPATVFGWTEGTGVWVLEGSSENHSALEKIYNENPNISENEALEKAGAKYYEHCMLV